MAESPEKTALAALTLNVIRTLNKLNEAAISEPDAKRRAKLRRVATELDTHNDEAMRGGLEYDSHYIVRLKTGRARTHSESVRSGRSQPGQRDERTDHPGLQAVRELIGRYPNKDVWDLVIKTIGDDLDMERLRECYTAWRAKNYAPHNLAWLTDWYRNGIPGSQLGWQNNGNRQPDATERNGDRLDGNLSLIRNIRRNAG